MKNLYPTFLSFLLTLMPLLAFGQTPQGCFTLDIGNGHGNVGETICVDVTVKDFSDILSMQYTMRWDPDALTYSSLSNFGLPDFDENDFGISTPLLNNGLMSLSWFPLDLVAVTLPDDAVLYTICFVIEQAPGSDIHFFENPTIVEISNGDEEVLAPNLLGGGIHTNATDGSMQISGCTDHVSCDGSTDGSIDLAVTGGTPPYSYLWSNGANTSSIIGLQPGQYTVTVTDQNNIERIALFFTGQYEDDFIESVTITPTSCLGNNDGSIEISVFGDVTDFDFIWSNGATTPFITDLVGGQYTLDLTHTPSGCTIQKVYFVNASPSYAIEAILTQADCEIPNSGAIDLTPTGDWEGQLYYSWSTGETTEDIAQLTPGVYGVTVTDDAGCISVFQYTIYQETDLDITYSVTPVSCVGSNGMIDLFLPDPASNYSILWSTGATTATITDLEAGTYGVTVSSAVNGCTWSESMEVSQDDIIAAQSWECTVFPDTSIVTVTAVVWGGGVPPYTFDWSTGDTTISDFLSQTTGNGTDTYQVTITDSDGCQVILDPIDPDCDPSNTPDPEVLDLYIPPVSIAPDGSACVKVKTTNFTDIESLQFSLNWNDAVVHYSHVQNINLQGVNASNFSQSGGVFSFNWTDALGPDNIVSLPNGATLFEICFDAVAPGGATTLHFADIPNPVEATNGDGTVVSIDAMNGYIEIINDDNLPVELSLPEATVPSGETICVGLSANNFFDLIGTQFTLTWDPDLLVYDGFQSGDLPNVSAGNFGTNSQNLDEGILLFSWFDPSLGGVSLANGANLFEVCFTAIGDEGSSPISIASSPVVVELVRENLELAPFAINDGLVTIETAADSEMVVLHAGSVAGEAGQVQCIDITAEQYEDILAMQFSMQWDPNIVTLETIFPGGDLPGFGIGNFGQSFVNEGKLTVSWFNGNLEPLTLAPGTVLFELCFELTGNTGTFSPIWFSNDPTMIEIIGENDVILPFNGLPGFIDLIENVWPGDTDNNDIVNHFDLLNIGLAYGSTGPSRVGATTSWTGQAAPDWTLSTLQSGTNYRHIDADGNGLIDAQDTLGIRFNWGETTNLWSEEDELQDNLPQSIVQDVPLYIKKDTILPSTTVSFDIILGEENFQAEGVYGIAFSILYDPSVVVPGSAHITPTNSWLETTPGNLLQIEKDFHNDGRIDVAFVRTDQNNTTGFGAIGTLNLTIEDVIFRIMNYEMVFDIENVRLINVSEEEIPVTPRETTTIIDIVSSTINPALDQQVRVFPNPTADQLNVVATDLQIQNISLFDQIGRSVNSLPIEPDVLSLHHLPDGVYLLRITTDQGIVMRKIVVHR